MPRQAIRSRRDIERITRGCAGPKQDDFHHARKRMLEIILILIALSLMAKRTPKRKRSFNLRRVKITPTLALSTLGSATALTVGLTGSADGQYRAMSVKATWSMEDHTAGEGQLVVGYAHSDYSVTEIKEALEAATAISLGDKIAQERSDRLVRIVGVFNGGTDSESLNDGRPIKTRLNWAIPIGKAVNFFVYNDSVAALSTGSVVHCNGNLWVKDV